MTLLMLVNLGLAGGDVAVSTPAVFGDLTTLFSNYLETLVNDDVSTLVMAAQPNVRNTTNSKDDLNTAYAEFLS
jgi:hypothetical protein